MGHRDKRSRAFCTRSRILIAGLLIAAVVFVIVSVLISDSTGPLQFITNPNVASNAFLPSEQHRECSATVGSLLPDRLVDLRNTLETRCQQAGEVSWSVFHANQTQHKGKYVNLMDTDFKYGTLRIRQPACLRLRENITVDFSPAYDHRVNESDPQYAALAYRVGYFAAITIETEDWTFDLGGFEMRQSRAMNIQQRPYAHVSLADRPFRFGDGPANFGDDEPVAARRGAIYNGKLGFSSHHGIHGNDVSSILIEDLLVDEYEVAGIALNGAEDIVIRNVSMLGTSKRVAVRGFYNQARVLIPITDRALTLSNDTMNADRLALVSARNALVRLMNDVVEDVITKGLPFINSNLHPEAHALFHNEGGMMDGNTYGMLLHPQGFAVENLRDEHTIKPARILVENVTIANTIVNVREVVALEDVAQVRIITGPVGDVFRVELVADHTQQGTYQGDALSELQMALAKFVDTLGLPPHLRLRYFNSLSITEELLQWREGGASLATAVEEGRYRYRRNGDTMFHVNKGAFGLRIDGGSDLCVRDLNVLGVSNVGARAQMIPLAGESPSDLPLYNGITDDGGHPAQAPQWGYMGADARGISIAATVDIVLERVHVSGVYSEWGWAHGIDVFNGAEKCALQTSSIDGVSTLEGEALADITDVSIGVKMGRAAGICLTEDAKYISQHDLSVTNVTAGVIGAAHTFLIDPLHPNHTKHNNLTLSSFLRP